MRTLNSMPSCTNSSLHSVSPYEAIANLSDDVTKSRIAFTGLVATAPYRMANGHWSDCQRRYTTLRAWQETSLRLFDADLRGDYPPGLAASLLDHVPKHLGWEHHRRMTLARVKPPAFFRTDQTAEGLIFEVQCPGSLWGVYELLLEHYTKTGEESACRTVPLSTRFAASLHNYLDGRPAIHHLLDNSSHPAGERFFIQRVRRHADYFGYDAVRPKECNFVRGHDFFALLAENFATLRLQQLMHGEIQYDLPPIVLFDQKLLLTLPFDNATRDFYTDETRALFPYTALLRPEGIQMEDGSVATIAKFSALPRSQRGFYVKYAGSDVNRNWGSQSVFHLGKLSRERCEALLNDAVHRFAAGERWILQRERKSREPVSFISRGGNVTDAVAHTKHSIFHGPDGALASLVMFEDFYKVHGSSDTVTTVALPAEHDELADLTRGQV